MYDCLIAFGSNQGNSETILAKAIDALQRNEIAVIATSKPRRTKPVGGPADQEEYLNAAIRIKTKLDPKQLHDVLIKTEEELGRVRNERWGARKIDLDLILFADKVINTSDLIVPHPRMSFRRFVLEPAVEIAPKMIHPISGRTLEQLIHVLDQPEKKMLIVCFGRENRESAREIRERLDSFLWQIEIVETFEQFQKQQTNATLVARFRVSKESQPEDQLNKFEQAAVNFAGSTLELPLDVDTASLELFAAVEAIEN